METLAIERHELATQGLFTNSASRAAVMSTGFAYRSAVVLHEVAAQSTAAIVTGETSGMPVLPIRRENSLGNGLTTLGTAMSINAVAVKGTTLLDDVLASDSPVALLARQHLPDAVVAMRLPLMIVERSAEFASAAVAVEVIGVPALSHRSEVLPVDALSTLVAAI